MQTENLTSLTAVRILRNGELVKTIENPALGTELTFKDENLDPGAYTYSVVTVNADGEGPAMSADTYVGVKLPASPQNVSFEENPAKLGEVTITWDAVNKAEDGSMIPPTFISYDVVELIGDKQILIATVTEPSYTYQAVEPGQLQQFKRYAVFAETESGVGRGLATATKPVGDPSKLPFAESYANAGVTTPIAINGAWGTVVDGDIVNGPVAVDGDNGYMVMIGTHIDETADYMIGKLDLTEAKSPYLSAGIQYRFPIQATPTSMNFVSSSLPTANKLLSSHSPSLRNVATKAGTASSSTSANSPARLSSLTSAPKWSIWPSCCSTMCACSTLPTTTSS